MFIVIIIFKVCFICLYLVGIIYIIAFIYWYFMFQCVRILLNLKKDPMKNIKINIQFISKLLILLYI